MSKASPGDLDELIAFEQQQTTPDGSGGQNLSWSENSPKSWAMVKPVRLSEEERQGAVRAGRGYLFTIRRRTDLDETMRIAWNGETFNIREIRLPRGRAMYMEIMAVAGVTQ